MNRSKIVIIINGRGGVGKDTLCELAARRYPVTVVSSITPIKEIAARCGWNGEKDDRSRRFLYELKRLLVEFNDYPCQYLMEQYRKFLSGEEQILFVHIREREEIDKFRVLIKDTPCVTLLVKRSYEDGVRWGNAADDEAEDYEYDYSYDNVKGIELTEKNFLAFLEGILKEYERAEAGQ